MTLLHPPCDYVGGRFLPLPGDDIISSNPAAPDRILWSGTPRIVHIEQAVAAARRAAPAWASRTLEERAAVLRRWQAVTERHLERIAETICDEMGKPIGECRLEAKLLGGKVDVTLGDVSLGRVREYDVKVSSTRSGWCRFKPHGVMAVIGPFNFPAHLPNGHFVPALLLGNTVVFKPSEKTAAVGQLIGELMDEAQVPPGVFNVVQGDGRIAAALVGHDDLDGILFTGSWPVGRSILEANLDRPGRLIALEMGGNSPAVVLSDAHLEQAVIECARSAYATTGQRCTCTRRIILEEAIAERFLESFCRVASTVRIGPGRSEPPVFMGPLITEQAVDAVLDFQDQLAARGGTVRVPCRRLAEAGGHFVSAGVIEVAQFTLDADCEIFGPLVQVAVVRDLDEAIEQTNATRFGLAAAIFTSSPSFFERFLAEVRAGCINHNTGTAGASSLLPFGGLGLSGNHRPAGAFSVDYCGIPVASMVEGSADVAVPPGMDIQSKA